VTIGRTDCLLPTRQWPVWSLREGVHQINVSLSNVTFMQYEDNHKSEYFIESKITGKGNEIAFLETSLFTTLSMI